MAGHRRWLRLASGVIGIGVGVILLPIWSVATTLEYTNKYKPELRVAQSKCGTPQVSSEPAALVEIMSPSQEGRLLNG